MRMRIKDIKGLLVQIKTPISVFIIPNKDNKHTKGGFIS